MPLLATHSHEHPMHCAERGPIILMLQIVTMANLVAPAWDLPFAPFQVLLLNDHGDGWCDVQRAGDATAGLVPTNFLQLPK